MSHHHQLFFPFHLLQPDDETNLFEYPDSSTRRLLPQNAAQKWLRNCGALTAANETLPQFFINRHPARQYTEMTTNLKSNSAYGKRVTDSTFERYLRKTIYWRQVTWDIYASEQCKQFIGTDEDHSMLFAAVFSTDAVDKIRVHNFHLRLMHAVFTFFQQNFRVVELGNQHVDYASLNTLFEWMLQVDEESKKSVGSSLQADMVKCIVLYLSRHKYLSKFVTTKKGKGNKRKCGIEQLSFTDKFDPTDQQFLQDEVVHPLDREIFKEIIKLHKKNAMDAITVDKILASLCRRRTFMMKGLLWAIRMCPFLFFTVYNPNTKTCIVIFNRGVDPERVPAFERGYNEQLFGPMPLYPRNNKRTRSRKKQATDEHDVSEDELSIPNDHSDFYVVADDDDQSNMEDSDGDGQESVSHRMEGESPTIDSTTTDISNNMTSRVVNSNDNKKRKRVEMERQGYLFVNMNGILRDHQKRFAIDCIRFMKDKSSDGYSIALTELTSRMTLLLPVIRTQDRTGDVLRVIRRFPSVFTESANSISLTGQVPSIEQVEEVLRGNSSDIFLFRKIVSGLQTESDISMDLDEMADRVDTEFLAADLRFTLSCVPDVFAIFTSKKSPDAPPVTMVRLLKPNVDPTKIVLVKKAKKLRTDGRNRNPEISYYE